MRKCIRCGAEMVENQDIRVEGAPYGIVLVADVQKVFSKRMGKPKVAVCPKCGEISLYMEHPEALSR